MQSDAYGDEANEANGDDGDTDVLEIRIDSPEKVNKRPRSSALETSEVNKRPRSSALETSEGEGRKTLKLSHEDPLDDSILQKKIGTSWIKILSFNNIIVYS